MASDRSVLERALRAGTRGQSAVELALVFPIVLVLFAGIFEFGRYYYARQTQRHTVFEAARFAVTGNVLDDPETGDPLTRVRSMRLMIERTADRTGLRMINMRVHPPDGGGPGEVVRITSRYRYTFVFPVVKNLLGPGHVDFEIGAAMRNEPVFARPDVD